MSEQSSETESTKVISFRLDKASYEALKAKGNKVSMGVNEYARALVCDQIDGKSTLLLVQNKLEKLEQRIVTAGIDVAFGVEQILLTIAGEDDKETEEWVEANLKCLAWNEEGGE